MWICPFPCKVNADGLRLLLYRNSDDGEEGGDGSDGDDSTNL